MNAFFVKGVLDDDPSNPTRIEAQKLLGDFTEEKVLDFHFFMRKGTEHEQKNRIELLRTLESNERK